jgi:hypothetical protein
VISCPNGMFWSAVEIVVCVVLLMVSSPLGGVCWCVGSVKFWVVELWGGGVVCVIGSMGCVVMCRRVLVVS